MWVRAGRRYLLGPDEDDVLLQQVSVVQVLEDHGHAGQQLGLVQLHQALEAPQKVLLGLLVVVAELRGGKRRWLAPTGPQRRRSAPTGLHNVGDRGGGGQPQQDFIMWGTEEEVVSPKRTP